jgi:hypothetical protein
MMVMDGFSCVGRIFRPFRPVRPISALKPLIFLTSDPDGSLSFQALPKEGQAHRARQKKHRNQQNVAHKRPTTTS